MIVMLKTTSNQRPVKNEPTSDRVRMKTKGKYMRSNSFLRFFTVNHLPFPFTISAILSL